MDVRLFCVCMRCQVEVSATSWSLVQRSPTDCCASLCVWSRNLVNEETIARAGLHSHRRNERRVRNSQSHGPRGLRCSSKAARLLRSCVRIPPVAWMFICCVCCQVEVSATSWSLVQRSPINSGASLCVIKKPCERGGHSPRWAAEPEKIIKFVFLLDDPNTADAATTKCSLPSVGSNGEIT
jgi:hypothetical protein